MLLDFDNGGWGRRPEFGQPWYFVRFDKDKYIGPTPSQGQVTPFLVAENYETEERYLAKNQSGDLYETTDMSLVKIYKYLLDVTLEVERYKRNYANYAGRNIKIIKFYMD